MASMYERLVSEYIRAHPVRNIGTGEYGFSQARKGLLKHLCPWEGVYATVQAAQDERRKAAMKWAGEVMQSMSKVDEEIKQRALKTFEKSLYPEETKDEAISEQE